MAGRELPHGKELRAGNRPPDYRLGFLDPGRMEYPLQRRIRSPVSFMFGDRWLL